LKFQRASTCEGAQIFDVLNLGVAGALSLGSSGNELVKIEAGES